MDVEPALLDYEDNLLRELARQAEYAQYNGLKGVRWVCSSEELAAALRLIAERLPARYKSMNVHFVVGGRP